MNTNKYIAGDWVKLIGVCPPRNGQIERVSEYFLLFKEGFYIVDFREIQPIPLTFKILEENRWELREHHERKHFEDVEWYLYHNPALTHVSLRFYPEEKAFSHSFIRKKYLKSLFNMSTSSSTYSLVWELILTLI